MNYAIPGGIAIKKEKKNKTLIIVLNCLFFIPLHLAWFVALYLATKEDKSDNAPPVNPLAS